MPARAATTLVGLCLIAALVVGCSADGDDPSAAATAQPPTMAAPLSASSSTTPASVDAFFENESGSITPRGSAGGEIELHRIAVFSSATEAAPFPSQVVSMSANADGRAANVALFGLNEADPFDDAARALLTELLTAS